MKANAWPRRAGGKPSERGQVGIGTMIVFIATILTAAVAAAVVIDTTNAMQEKASRTGVDATDHVSSNIFVSNAQGIVDGNGEFLDAINVSISLAPGGRSLDLRQMLVRLGNGTVVRQLTYDSTGAGTTFSGQALRDADGSFTPTNPGMTTGDLVSVNFDLTATGADLEVAPRTFVELTMQPEVGTRFVMELRTPASFVADKIVLLR